MFNRQLAAQPSIEASQQVSYVGCSWMHLPVVHRSGYGLLLVCVNTWHVSLKVYEHFYNNFYSALAMLDNKEGI